MRAPTSIDQNRSGFRVRPARRGDWEALASLLAELGYPGAADQATVHWVISHPEIEVFVAGDAQDKPVGMITFTHRPQLRANGRIATIEELVVTAPWRRRGVGRELIQRVIDRARMLSVKQLDVVPHQPLSAEVRTFFDRCGFGEAAAGVLRLRDVSLLRK